MNAPVLDRLVNAAGALRSGRINEAEYIEHVQGMRQELDQYLEPLTDLHGEAASDPEVAELYAAIVTAAEDLQQMIMRMQMGLVDPDELESAISRIRKAVEEGRQKLIAVAPRYVDLDPPPAPTIIEYRFCCRQCGTEFLHQEESTDGKLVIDLFEVECPECGWCPGEAEAETETVTPQ